MGSDNGLCNRQSVALNQLSAFLAVALIPHNKCRENVQSEEREEGIQMTKVHV